MQKSAIQSEITTLEWQNKGHLWSLFFTAKQSTMAKVVILMDQDAFARRLKRLRSAQGLSQSAMAETLGVSRSCVKNWESSINFPPVDLLVGIALFFHVSTDFLLGIENRKCIQCDFLSDHSFDALSAFITAIDEETDEKKKPSTTEDEKQ